MKKSNLVAIAAIIIAALGIGFGVIEYQKANQNEAQLSKLTAQTNKPTDQASTSSKTNKKSEVNSSSSSSNKELQAEQKSEDSNKINLRDTVAEINQLQRKFIETINDTKYETTLDQYNGLKPMLTKHAQKIMLPDRATPITEFSKENATMRSCTSKIADYNDGYTVFTVYNVSIAGEDEISSRLIETEVIQNKKGEFKINAFKFNITTNRTINPL